MRGTSVYPLRCPIHLDRSAVDDETGGVDTQARSDGRAGKSAAQEKSNQGTRARLHTPAGISGRSGRVRGPVKRRIEFSQPEPVSGRHPCGSGRTVYARSRGDLCSDPHRVFAGAADGGTLSAWRSVCEAADGRRLDEKEDFTTECTENTEKSKSAVLRIISRGRTRFRAPGGGDAGSASQC